MIITRTPFRMSFFGGGTDIKEYFEECSGAVLSTTIDKYCYVTVRHLPRFFDYKNQVTYSRIERVGDRDEIEHPMVRNAMKMLDMHELVITYDADLPARTGIGTSSSFAVGLLNAFYALKGKYVGKKKLADDAIYLERGLCNEAGGWQDQIAASFGNLNRIDFHGNGYEVHPVIIHPDRKKELNKRLMLFYTGISRYSAEIQTDTQSHMGNVMVQLAEMKALVNQAEELLEDKSRELKEFGMLLDYAWKIKRQTGSRVSTNFIDEMYKKAKAAGALGGKILGAGGGGFLLLYVEEDYQNSVRKAMNGLLEVPFMFEESGSEIIYYAPESYRPEA